MKGFSGKKEMSNKIQSMSDCPIRANGVAVAIPMMKHSHQNQIIIDITSTKWFYFTLCALTTLTMFNLGTNLWLIKTLRLSADGIGEKLLFNKRGIDIKNEATFVNWLQSEIIKGSNDQPLMFNSEQQLAFTANDIITGNQIHLLLGKEKLEIQAPNFNVYETVNNLEKLKFSIKSGELVTDDIRNFGKNELTGGLAITNSFLVNHLQGDFSKDLFLESRTEKVEMNAENDVNINSKAGEINFNSFNEINLIASDEFVFNTNKVEIKHLPISYNDRRSADEQQENSVPVFQVCSCENGEIFLARSTDVCKANADVCEN